MTSLLKAIAALERFLDFADRVVALLRVKNTELAIREKNETKDTTRSESILRGE